MGGLHLHKKSEIGLGVIVLIVVILFSLGWVINLNQRECRSNKDCDSEAYCGSDFSCHSYPNIQKTVIQYNLFWSAVIIGMAIIAATIMSRWDKISKEKITEERKIYTKEANEEAEEVVEPYYRSTINIKTP